MIRTATRPTRSPVKILAIAIALIVGAGMLAGPAWAGHKQKHRHRAQVERYDDERYDDRYYSDSRHDHRRDRHRRPDRDARSHHRYGYGHDDHPRARRYKRHHDVHPFEIPRRIARHTAARLRDFFLGRVYFEAHHHYHDAYSFPVNGHWEPRYYCEGKLFSGHVSLRGPRFSLRLGF